MTERKLVRKFTLDTEIYDTEIAAVADQLRLHAKIQSDWPLEIVYAKEPVKILTEDMEIDCPDFLLYHENADGSWSLKRVENLAAAQFQITKNGYNRKSTARMAVLHNVQPLGFSGGTGQSQKAGGIQLEEVEFELEKMRTYA